MFTKMLLLIFVLIFNPIFAQWQQIAPGLSLGKFDARPRSDVGDSKITILKIDPHLFQFKLISTGQTKDKPLTADQWAQKYGLIAVTNAGMFDTDFTTHIGYMKNFDYINNPDVNSYKSVAAFNPIDSTAKPFMIFDLDRVSFDQILKQYQSLIQNIRIIRRPGENRWHNKIGRWSEAALGQDKYGNVLFIFCRSPYNMSVFSQILLNLPINIACAQHLEGGPEASFYLKYGELEIKISGSYETGFNENDSNPKFWPIPNVLGIVAKN